MSTRAFELGTVDVAARSGEAASRPTGASADRIFRGILLLLWIGVAGGALYWGYDYYVTPLQDRPFSDLHELLKPSGLFGQGYGVVGALFITVGVFLYAIRKRVPPLRRLGKLKHWLQVHIFLCTLGPFLVLLHTGFKIGGIVAIAFWSMVVVTLSGIFGRYVYVRIPKTIGGQFASLGAIRSQKRALLESLQADFDLDDTEIAGLLEASAARKPRGFLDALGLAVRHDLVKWSLKRRIRRLLAQKGIPPGPREAAVRLVQEGLRLEQQILLLQPFQQLFRYWHILHMPLAALMFLVMLLHVGVAVMFGYTWIF
jgi:hypothetical protein